LSQFTTALIAWSDEHLLDLGVKFGETPAIQ